MIARFGIYKARIGDLFAPLYGLDLGTIQSVSRDNPIELVDRTHLRDGQLAMYVGYAGKDEYNIDAQVESFLYLCKFRGITVHVGYDPEGRHDAATAQRLLPGLMEFLNRQVGPYAPDGCGVCGEATCLPCVSDACSVGTFVPGACSTGTCLPDLRRGGKIEKLEEHHIPKVFRSSILWGGE